MRPSTKRMIFLLVTGLLFILSLAVYTNMIRPAYDNIQQLRGELQAKEQLFDEQRMILARMRQILTQLEDEDEFRARVAAAFPPEENAAALLAQVSAMSAASGANLLSFNVRPASEVGNNLGVLQMNARFAGPYRSLQNVLRLLETNIRVIDLDQLRVQPLGTADQDLYTYTLVAETYYQQ